MREIKECTAEVFRRSEKRIKERKRNRSRILAFCIPLCLIVTVWSIMIRPASKGNNSAGESMDIVGGVDGSNAVYARVEVFGTGISTQSSIRKEDAKEVAKIYYTVQSSFVNSGGGNKEPANEKPEEDALTEENKDFSQSETTNLSSGFRIIFTTENGAKIMYSLTGDKLISEATKEETVLTEDQRSNLLNMLGLTITWEDPQ